MKFLSKQMGNKKIIIALAALTLIVYQVVRVVVFVDVYGGLEHDGGWFLNVSRSLAERGTYTTLVSTIADPTVSADRNVDGKFDIQDEAGRIWFFTGNGNGPVSIIVNAFFLKLFGFGFWQFHLGPLFFFALYLLAATLILLLARGLSAVILFHLYLFLYPTLSIFLSYEAMGEGPSLALILLTYLVFAYTLYEQRSWRWFLASGLMIGLTFNTKIITLLSLGGIFVLWLKLVWQRQIALKETMILIGSAISLPLLWEVIQGVILIRLTNFDLYLRHLQARIGFILDDGSGLGAQDYNGFEFYWDKIMLISEISHPNPWLTVSILILVAGGGIALIWLYRADQTRQNLLILVWTGWLGNAIWFIGLGKTGWVRHAWLGLMLAVIILSWLFGELVHRIREQPNGIHLALMGLLIGLLIPGFIAQSQAATVFISDLLVEHWREEQLNAKYTQLPWIITPRAEQKRVVKFLQQLPPEANVFYPANHKAAEIAVQTGQIFYPIARRDDMSPTAEDVVLVGATLISPWKDAGIRHSIIEQTRQECPHFLYESDYYIICRP